MYAFHFYVCKPVVTLVGGMSFTFYKEGTHTVTVQVSVGNTVLQDKITVAVYGEVFEMTHLCITEVL